KNAFPASSSQEECSQSMSFGVAGHRNSDVPGFFGIVKVGNVPNFARVRILENAFYPNRKVPLRLLLELFPGFRGYLLHVEPDSFMYLDPFFFVDRPKAKFRPYAATCR